MPSLDPRWPTAAPASLMTHLSLFVLLVTWSAALSDPTGAVCDHHEQVNLSALEEWTWSYEESKAFRNEPSAANESRSVKTETFFRFCHPFTEGSLPAHGCSGAHACVVRTFSNGTRFVEAYTISGGLEGLQLFQLPFSSNSTCANQVEKRIHVDFSCDQTRGLGRPIKLVTQPCVTTFNWPTVAACGPQHKHPILSKCYVYDGEGNLRDLSPLISPNAHAVAVPASEAAATQTQYFINICSEVNEVCAKSTSSSSGTSVCSRPATGSAGERVDHLGDVRKSVISYDNTSNEVVVKYLSTSKLPSCSGNPFVTQIRLRCPQTRGEFSYYGLQSRKPFLVEKTDCEMLVEWQTDFACPTHMYEKEVTTKSCGIHVDGEFLDLKPLSRNEGYLISKAVSGNQTLDIALNICAGIGSRRRDYCGKSDWESDGICVRFNDSSPNLVATLNRAKLTFADGTAHMRYYAQTSTKYPIQPPMNITFVCDPRANDGSPAFVSFRDGVLSLLWRTSRVCLTRATCALTTPSGALYDLSPLHKKSNQSRWHVSLADFRLSDVHDLKLEARDSLSLNVCAGMSEEESSTPDSCPVVLTRNESRECLGRYPSPLTFDPETKRLTLVYSGPEMQDAGRYKLVRSTIQLTCAPGNLESEPKLVSISTAEIPYQANYTFEWKTGAACPLALSHGTDCVVVDKQLGLKLDLNPLHEEHHDIVINQGNLKYHLNICGRLKGQDCLDEDSGACRVDASGKKTSLGRFSRNVTYWNGILTLVYDSPSGESSVISVVCDESDSRVPELVSEQGQRHTFRMYSKHACPDLDNVISCVWENGTHVVDLSSLSNSTDNHFHLQYDSTDRMTTIYYFSFCRPLTRLRQEESNCREGSAACRVVMKNGVVTSTTSLGIPKHSPLVYFGEQRLSLIYPNGDVCPGLEGSRASTIINLYCDPNEGDGVTHTIIRGEDNCSVEIWFRTALVCHVFPLRVPKSPAVVAPTPQTPSHSWFSVLVLLLLILVCLVMSAVAYRADLRSRVMTRLRSLVCRDLVPSNPIHYSQVSRESQAQLLPMNQVDSRVL